MTTQKNNRVTSIIDTNIFLSTGDEVFTKLENRDIVIPLTVYKEIEKYRTDTGGRGYAARTVIRLLDDIRIAHTDDLAVRSVRIPNSTNTIRIEVDHTQQDSLRSEIRDDKDNDKVILAVVKNLSQSSDQPVEFITNDAPLRFIASVVEKIDAKPYDDGADEKFDGRIVLDLDELGVDGELDDEDILKYVSEQTKRVPANSLIVLRQGGAEDWLMKKGDRITNFAEKNWEAVGPIHPRNKEQALATSYLNDSDIQMLSLGGVAGAGKSLLAISYGLEAVKHKKFDKITVFRSMYAVGRQETGFLPGDADDKMRPWAQAVWDNVRKYDSLTHKGKNRRTQSANSIDADIKHTIEDKYEGMISIEPITYLRGRTLENQLIIVDDAQSLDRSILLDIVSRLGDKSKIIFTFDMDQQDNPYLSKGTNIVSLIARLKLEPMFAHVDFTISERSSLAQLASRLLSELS
jgi:PhoH-like ATPase